MLPLYLFVYGQVVPWYGQVVFLQPVVRGQVYIFEILPPLLPMYLYDIKLFPAPYGFVWLVATK